MAKKEPSNPSVNYETKSGAKYVIEFHERYNHWFTTHEGEEYRDDELPKLKEKLEKLTSAAVKKYRKPCLLVSRGDGMKVTVTSLTRYGNQARYVWKDKYGSNKRDETYLDNFYEDTPENDTLQAERVALYKEASELHKKAEAVLAKMKKVDFTELKKMYEGVR